MDTVVILGSSNSRGDTAAVVETLTATSGWDCINLNDYDISYFDYEHRNRGDDFLPLIRRILDEYETLLFATPVYWYSMSGIMKVFFDRFTDLLTIEKELGRRLRGKNMAALSCSHGNNLGESFWLPFSQTADYLGMAYLGHMHAVAGRAQPEKIAEFISAVNWGTAEKQSLR